MKHNNNIEEVFEKYDREFSPFFETRLMAKLSTNKSEVFAERVFDLFFRRIAYSGIAAIALVALMLFYFNGTVSVDSLMGLGNLDAENSIAILLDNM